MTKRDEDAETERTPPRHGGARSLSTADVQVALLARLERMSIEMTLGQIIDALNSRDAAVEEKIEVLERALRLAERRSARLGALLVVTLVLIAALAALFVSRMDHAKG